VQVKSVPVDTSENSSPLLRKAPSDFFDFSFTEVDIIFGSTFEMMALFSASNMMVLGPILAFSAKSVSANLRPHAFRKFPSKTAAFSSFNRQSKFERSIGGHHSNKMKSALFGGVAGEGKGASIRDSLKEISESGEFKRKESAWRNWISKGGESTI
jgi:hypothetical protein